MEAIKQRYVALQQELAALRVDHEAMQRQVQDGEAAKQRCTSLQQELTAHKAEDGTTHRFSTLALAPSPPACSSILKPSPYPKPRCVVAVVTGSVRHVHVMG